MKYLKAEHFIIDFQKGTKTPIGTFYATKDFKKEINEIHLNSTRPERPNATIKLEGHDHLAFKTYLVGSEQVISSGRFLNHNYEEMIFSADLSEKGLWVDGVISQISPVLFVSTKTIKIKATGVPTAVIQEVIHYISKDEFEAAKSNNH